MKVKIILLITFLCTQFSFAQKSAPVAGDAAQLIDLLKKDYDAINPELRDEQLSKDMFKVTSFFKSYLKDDERKKDVNRSDIFNGLQSNSLISLSGNVNTEALLFEEIDNLRENFDDFNLDKLTEASSKEGDYDYDVLSDSKKYYFTSKFYKDLHDLEHLRLVYDDAKNTYLSYVLTLFIKKYDSVFNHKTDFTGQVNYNSSVQKALPFLGGDLSFKSIIDGLSRFLAKRIKEEITTHAIEKVQYYLNNPSKESYLNELLVLLPVTTDYLKSFKASQVLNFTDDLKQYIEKDLNNLLANAVNLKTTPRFEQLIKNNPDIGFAFEALDLIPQISKIKEPLDYFQMLENSENMQRWATDENKVKYNIANSIKLTSLLAHSLLVIDEGKQKLVSLDFMSNYGAEREFFLLYMGFLHQQNAKYFNASFKKIDNGDPVGLQLDYLMTQLAAEDVTKNSKALLFIKQQLTRIATHTEKLQKEINGIKKASKSEDKVNATEVHSLIETLLDFSEEITTTTERIIHEGSELKFFITDITNENISGKTASYFKTAYAVNNIFLDLHNEKYTTAIISALEIPSNFTNREISLDKVMNLQNILMASDNLKLIKELNAYKNIPNSEVKKEALKILATRLEYLIKQSDNANLSNVKAKFTEVFNAIKNDSKTGIFKDKLDDFKEALKNDYELVLKEYADIDINELLKEPILNIIERNSSIEFKEDDLKAALDAFIAANFKSYTLEDDEGLETIKNDLLRDFTVYLPELSGNVFRIKDDNVLRIIHFITDMALSEDAEDIEVALDAFALPSGSSSLKEDTSNYFSINSYPGVLLGVEISDLATDKSAFNAGITAPIGIYAHLGTTKKKHSWGLFVPIIDIGAPVRLRIDDNDATETLPDFDFKDIFSPGLYVSWGLPNSPFAINVGIQYGPKLRGIDNGEGNFIDAESYRIGVGLVIDIPLFTLYNGGMK